MCQEDTRHSIECLRTGTHRTLHVSQARKTQGRVHKRASRRCSLCVRVPGPNFATFLLLNIFYIVIILDVSENQYGDCIQNSGGWVMAERRGREAKVENSTNIQLLLCCKAITSQETFSDKPRYLGTTPPEPTTKNKQPNKTNNKQPNSGILLPGYYMARKTL